MIKLSNLALKYIRYINTPFEHVGVYPLDLEFIKIYLLSIYLEPLRLAV